MTFPLHEITYRLDKTRNRRKKQCSCSCGFVENERTWSAAFKRVAKHLEDTAPEPQHYIKGYNNIRIDSDPGQKLKPYT